MSCKFSIPSTLPATDIVSRASVAIKNAGGDFVSTDSGGVFNVPVTFGTISGSFEIISGSANVKITEKPFFVSCTKIENALTAYINGI